MVKVMSMSGQPVAVQGFKMPKQRKAQPLAAKVRKLEKQVLLNADEWKVIDSVGSTTASTTATFALLNGLAPGDGFNTRDGREVSIQSIQMKFRAEVDPSAAATNGTSPVRFIIFIDKQANAAAPTIGDLLDVSVAGAVDALRNLNNRKRFKILMDRRAYVSLLSPGGWTDDFYLKRTDLVKTIYNAGVAGTIADITSGSVYLMFCSDVVAASLPPAIVYNARLRFTE